MSDITKFVFVVQRSYEDGPWTDEVAYPNFTYATQVYADRVQLNRHENMRFRIIKRVVITQETDITP